MANIFYDRRVSDEVRRAALYEGALFQYSPNEPLNALIAHARQMIEEAFHPLDPETAQFEMSVADYAALLTKLKPAFIHHPRCKELICEMLVEFGCDPAKTHFDLPRLRSATSNEYLTTGIAYAFHPHRDTWYSAAPCQLNWWTPIYPIEDNNGMAFHTKYWDRAVKNNSNDYDYYLWNKYARASAGQHVKTDTRVQPMPMEKIDLDPQVRMVAPPGSVTVFSAAQLHSTVPNTSGRTRFSIDFRTIHIDDARARVGAPMLDAACTGTALRDFLRLTDLERVPDSVAELYDDGASKDGVLIYVNPDRM